MSHVGAVSIPSQQCPLLLTLMWHHPLSAVFITRSQQYPPLLSRSIDNSFLAVPISITLMPQLGLWGCDEMAAPLSLHLTPSHTLSLPLTPSHFLSLPLTPQLGMWCCDDMATPLLHGPPTPPLTPSHGPQFDQAEEPPCTILTACKTHAPHPSTPFFLSNCTRYIQMYALFCLSILWTALWMQMLLVSAAVQSISSPAGKPQLEWYKDHGNLAMSVIIDLRATPPSSPPLIINNTNYQQHQS